MPSIKLQKTFAAPASVVFEALTLQKNLEQWFATEVIAFPKEGTYAAFAYGFDLNFKVYLLKLEQNKKVVWEFVDGGVEWDDSLISFELHEQNGKTKLFFEHRRLKPNDKWEKWKNSWRQAFDKLKAIVEKKA